MRPIARFNVHPSLAALLACAGVGQALRTQELATISYWFDESFTWKMIHYSWGEMFSRIARDNSPPLYYVLLKLWAGVWGDSPSALRAFSGFCGMMTVTGVYLFVREGCRVNRQPAIGRARETGPAQGRELPGAAAESRAASGHDMPLRRQGDAAWLAAALVALSPFQVVWSLQVRMFSLLAALAAVSSWLMLRALRATAESQVAADVAVNDQAAPRPAGPAWLLYTLFALAVAYTHNFGLLTVAAQYVFLLALSAVAARGSAARMLADKRLRAAACSLSGFALGWVPWAPVFAAQWSQVRNNFWIPPASLRTVAATCYQMFSFSQYHVAPDEIMFGALELCVLLMLSLAWRRRAFEAYVALATMLPAVLVLSAQACGAKIWDTHYFLAVHLFWVVALALVVSRIPRRWPRSLVSAAAVLSFLALDARHWQLRDAQALRPGAIAAMAWLDAARRSDEPVIVCSPMLHTTVAAHSRNRDGMYVFQWPFAYVHFHGTAVFDRADFVDGHRLQSLQGKWLWVVDTEGWSKGTWTVPMPPCWKLKGQQSFTAIEGEDYQMIIRLYRREGGDEAKMRLTSDRL